MVQCNDLVQFLDEYLAAGSFNDYCPNGLQVEGKSQVKRIVTGVTACQALIDRAVSVSADLLLVHHGFFWKHDARVVTGMMQRRLKALLTHDINLVAYHLPLDVHPLVGNNARFGRALGIPSASRFSAGGVADLLSLGELPQPLSGRELKALLTSELGQEPLHIAAGERPIRRVAWCTGAAQDMLVDAVSHGADAFITGEVSERTVHQAREYGIHFFAAGHHATERYGVQALVDVVKSSFSSVTIDFIDIDNPV